MKRRPFPLPEYPSKEEVKQHLIRAIVKLYRQDLELLEIDAHERSITFKLGNYLQEVFPEWNVDCEYNRQEGSTKKLDLNTRTSSPEDRKPTEVFPDIIVHRRMTDRNLLAIEVKKKKREEDRDIEKIQAFIDSSVYHYRYGLFLRLRPQGCIGARFFDGNNQDEDHFLRQIQVALATLAVNE